MADESSLFVSQVPASFESLGLKHNKLVELLRTMTGEGNCKVTFSDGKIIIKVPSVTAGGSFVIPDPLTIGTIYVNLLDAQTIYGVNGVINNLSAPTFGSYYANIESLTATSVTAYTVYATAVTASSINATRFFGSTATFSTLQGTSATFTALRSTSITSSTIYGTDITSNSLSTSGLSASTITASSITASQITGSSVTATSITATTITAASITATSITATDFWATSITATSITASSITAAQFWGTSITATTITATSYWGNSLTLTNGGNTISIAQASITRSLSLKEIDVCSGGVAKKMLILASDPY